MPVVIGIDPGLDGAVAVLPALTLYDTPTATVTGKSSRRVHLPQQMVAILRPFADGGVLAVLEAVHARPGQGVRSMFSMGRGYGLWEGILAALGIPYELVAPERWKRVMMSDMGKEKDASRVRALQVFPQAAEHLKLKKHHGRADALLLAEYGRRCYRMETTERAAR